MHPLDLAARHGPVVLICGLVLGVTAPPLAAILRPWIPQLVVVLLFLAVVRMEPRAILGSLSDLPRTIRAVLLLQLAAPLMLIGLASVLGLSGSPVVLALVLMLAAPSIVGSPNICLMMGRAPDPALRLMVSGTALLPLTVLPVVWSLPDIGDLSGVVLVALRLLVTIVGTALAAVAVRTWLLKSPSPHTLRRLDGVSAIALAVFVIGLMEAVSDGFAAQPVRFFGWLALALVANFGAQLAMWGFSKQRMSRDEATALSVIAGNRNVSLYFLSLPPETIAPLLVFIGCYQIPMYLTPLVMRRIFGQSREAS